MSSSTVLDTKVDNKIKIVTIPNMPIFKIRVNPYEWEEVIDIIKSNKLEKFARLEEVSEKYLHFKKQLVTDNLTIFKYLIINQLQWYNKEENDNKDINDLSDDEIKVGCKSDKLFLEPSDLKILANDFPYNFKSNIAHLCVWTKFKIPVDPSSPIGDISQKTKDIINAYLKKTFCGKYGIKWEDIIWFKNWESLQSVKSLSHVHVIINNLDQNSLQEMLYTSGEPLSIEELEEIEN